MERPSLNTRRRGAAKRLLRGGSFVGEGSYGCTFSPPLQSAGASGGLGKVLESSAAADEYAAVLKFLRVDPRGRYGVYGTPPLALSVDDVREPRDEVEKCHVRDVRRSLVAAKDAQGRNLHLQLADVREIVMAKGRGDMAGLLRDTQDALADTAEGPASAQGALDCALHLALHLLAARNLIVGGATYNAAGLYHLDIKAPNVVGFGSFDAYSGAQCEYKFIDFGLSRTAAQLGEDVARFSLPLTLRHASYPPISALEVAFLASVVDPPRFVVQAGMQAWFDAARTAPDGSQASTVLLPRDTRRLRVYQADVDAVVARTGGSGSAAASRDLLLRHTDMYSLAELLKAVLASCGAFVRDGGPLADSTYTADLDHAGLQLLGDATLAPLVQLVFDMQHLRLPWSGLVARYDSAVDAFLGGVTSSSSASSASSDAGRRLLALRREQLRDLQRV